MELVYSTSESRPGVGGAPSGGSEPSKMDIKDLDLEQNMISDEFMDPKRRVSKWWGRCAEIFLLRPIHEEKDVGMFVVFVHPG